MTPAELLMDLEDQIAEESTRPVTVSVEDARLLAAALRGMEAAPDCHTAHESSSAYQSYATALAAYRAERAKVAT